MSDNAWAGFWKVILLAPFYIVGAGVKKVVRKVKGKDKKDGEGTG